MSLVGPRPEIPDVVKYYPEAYRQRLLVVPGITGLAQISGRGEIELGKTVYYDLTYIKKFSVWFDIVILFILLYVNFQIDMSKLESYETSKSFVIKRFTK